MFPTGDPHAVNGTGDEEAVGFLLEKGADKTVKTKDGRIPLQVGLFRLKQRGRVAGLGLKGLKALVAMIHSLEYTLSAGFWSLYGGLQRCSRFSISLVKLVLPEALEGSQEGQHPCPPWRG